MHKIYVAWQCAYIHGRGSTTLHYENANMYKKSVYFNPTPTPMPLVHLCVCLIQTTKPAGSNGSSALFYFFFINKEEIL